VADFLDKVPDPDDAAVRTLFERYKLFEPTPGAPVPGFKIPAKVALQYFTADYEQFEDLAAVTDQEIRDEYEKNKNTRYLQRPDFGIPSKGAGDADGTEPAAPGSEAEPDEAGADKQPNGDAAKESAPADEQPEPEAKLDGAAPPAAKPANPPQQSRDKRGLDGTELALADIRQTGDDANAQSAPTTPADDSKPADSKRDESRPADESQQAEPKADDGTTAESDKSAETAAEKALTESASTDPSDSVTPKYEPLSKVESSIRAELARQKATKKMQDVLAQLREKLVKYGNDRTRWEVKHERDKTLQAPKPLDFDSLAAEHHVSAHQTELLTAIELREAGGIGESFVGQGTPFLAYAFGQSQLYQAAMVMDNAGNQYLVWKTEQQPARVPELSEKRDEVVRVWKMIEARKPAVEHAKSLVETARKDELPLAEFATRDDQPAAIKPEPFSWLTYGTTANINNNMPPRLSAVTGIEDAGNDFMQVVFSQPVGGIGIAFNNPQTICYVVQVTEHEPGLTVLQRTFLADDYRTYARVALPRQQLLGTAWNNSIKQEAGLKWVRPPDARRARPEAEGDFDDNEAGD